ncbi:RNA polymerase sigma factor [Chitinophaga eiseniae]|uniref:RNA polymerase sigma-70 factor n=1 Tax=Chitinophaga eiseniae TaxID=634771 RepID=A0A847SE05_9BACT|nr:RNA polymerase sigma-70 factor [Chitinophaga eiseniae]NLR78414.1 RNA polymerase sigma-70 factor [Chitinophaga eiseniae]
MDRELLEQVAGGDEQAFQVLFSTYRERLYHYILGIVKSAQVAEELVMDVFLKIWIGRDVVPQIENMDAFLFRVACNKSIDFLRKASTSRVLTDITWDNIQIAESSDPESRLIHQEYDQKLREAIDLLPPKRREVYRLSREEGLSHAEIAEKLGIAPSTIANQIVDAQRFIKSYLFSHLKITIILALLALELKKVNNG